MKTATSQFVLALSVSALLLGCAPEKRTTDVWDAYEVRHPVPVAAPVPVYDAYPIDNDAYYAVPDCSVMDSPSCAGSD